MLEGVTLSWEVLLLAFIPISLLLLELRFNGWSYSGYLVMVR